MTPEQLRAIAERDAKDRAYHEAFVRWMEALRATPREPQIPEDLAVLGPLPHIADVRRGQVQEDRSALLELLRVEPLPLDDPPVMVRSWTEGLRLLAQDMGFYRGEREIAEALRSKPEPRFGECLPVGPLGQSISGRQASLRVVLVRDRAALAVYFDDTRVGPAIQLDRADRKEAVADQPSPTPERAGDRKEAVADQPSPTPERAGLPAVWDLVIADVAKVEPPPQGIDPWHVYANVLALVRVLAERAGSNDVLTDMAERDRLGRERYGTPLQPFNGRRAAVDAYQEALDLAVYMRQALYEGCGR